MSKTKKQWERQRSEAADAIHEIEAKERAERNASLVGKCFRYHNSYGGGYEKWWLYARVIGVDEWGQPLLFKFQTTSSDEIQIEPAARGPAIDMYEPISNPQFFAAWQALQLRIADMSAAIAKVQP